MSEAPKKIWLQTGCEDSGCDGDCSFSELGEVTWCEDKIHKDDIQYIRADIVDELAKALFIAANVFRTYQAHHEAKGDNEKAERNKSYAEGIEAAMKHLVD